MIYNFNDKKSLAICDVGGKAKALIDMTLAGFPVPNGIVLSTQFFKPWIDSIKRTDEWRQLTANVNFENCAAVRKIAESMSFDSTQKSQFDNFVTTLDTSLFAVRSSSPEEDLSHLSFAGMYDTELAVNESDLEKTVALIFASCFDYRVMSYKLKNGISVANANIAVIIQSQIASDVSGVAFSLNPLNNAFDEVLINASFGLGESIVSGIVSPDSYIVDTATDQIIDKKIAAKHAGIVISKSGGTVQIENADSTSNALSDNQIFEIAQMVKRIESHCERPIDIEWAYCGNQLYLLQSRPITSHFPFFKELLTERGQNKRFYIDLMALTQGFDKPMSVLGLQIWANMIYDIKAHMMTPQINGSTPAINGKQYISMTAFQKLVGKSAARKFIHSYDKNIKKIFADIDLRANPFEGKVEGADDFKFLALKGIIKMLPAALKGTFGNYRKAVADYNLLAKQILGETAALNCTRGFTQLTEKASAIMLKAMGTAPVLIGGFISKSKLEKLFKDDDVDAYISAMNMDLDGNPTSEMGHLLFAMANTPCFKAISSREQFVAMAKERAFDAHFLAMYDQFMTKFSARGFNEVDVATKRIYEDLGLLYDKLIEIDITDNQILTVREKREQAYQKLLEIARRKGKEKKFVDLAARTKATFGYREHPKYMIVIIIAKVHDICLEIASHFVAENRLDDAYDIFDLKIDQIDNAINDKSIDLRVARQNNLASYIDSDDWPLVIDSRGKIYKSKLEVKDGDYIGDAIAPGKVRGTAKVMRTPYQKELKSGDILIAKFTEPSWTPIFTNAAAVVMEIGGPLQHGGIIAREYGIPCVSGLMGIMEKIKDGDVLEVDGDNGIVRIIES